MQGIVLLHMVYRCKLREKSVIAMDYRIFHSELVGINEVKKLTAFKIEQKTKLNTNYFA